MKYICALIVVEDVLRSRRLYQTILGQEMQADYGENVAFKGGFAIHKKDHFKMLLNNAPVTTGGNNVELYFEEDDLEPVEKMIQEEGLEFVHGITEQPWRQKMMRFYDYDKNMIEVGESMEHVAYRLSKENLSIDEISGITYLPAEAVKRSIEIYEGT